MKTVTALVILVFLSGCTSPYLGKHLSEYASGVCRFGDFPAECSFSDKNFAIDYVVEETGTDWEYRVSGTAQYIGGQTFTSFNGLSFTLLLISNDTIVETTGMSGGTGSLGSKINFSKTFTSVQSLDAGTFTYHTKVSG